MKYIKLKCNGCSCKAESLIAMNEWYIEEYGDKVNNFYTCPICEDMIFPEDDCIVIISQ